MRQARDGIARSTLDHRRVVAVERDVVGVAGRSNQGAPFHPSEPAQIQRHQGKVLQHRRRRNQRSDDGEADRTRKSGHQVAKGDVFGHPLFCWWCFRYQNMRGPAPALPGMPAT